MIQDTFNDFDSILINLLFVFAFMTNKDALRDAELMRDVSSYSWRYQIQ
jgi:hypothetical protein